MNVKEWAMLLDGREYGSEVSNEESKQAASENIVIVYGYSDDNMEFAGAITDEVGCYDGGIALINPATGDLFVNECEDESCPYAHKEAGECLEITAVWADPAIGGSWSYRTDIPHKTFRIMEDGELYCVGIVFSLDDLEEVQKHEQD